MIFAYLKVGASDLEIYFEGKYGQVEVGSKYAGVEFHHSRPLPARISFYYPVANSLDLSRGYWKRDESMPFSLTVAYDDKIDSIGYNSFAYRYTPFSVVFMEEFEDYHLQISYDFCADIPVLVYSIVLENRSGESKEYKIQTETQMVLRTCHTYNFKEVTSSAYSNDHQLYIAEFDDPETDSALVFISNVGLQSEKTITADGAISPASFVYRKTLETGEKIRIIQLIGSCRAEEEVKIISEYSSQWQENVLKNKNRIEKYALHESPIIMGDSILEQTVRWSKAVLESNIHYLNGQYVPMPCPAEYNFFFTHDVLLTDLGAAQFDLERVKRDLLYLKSLTKEDSVLPHAYYWRDEGYVTEYCGSDNWNHFWFIILANSYYKHSGDIETLISIFPIIEKSIKLVLKNKLDDDLMYGTQPDWWDIGKIFGARSYISLLMIKALQDYAALCLSLKKFDSVLPSLELSHRMRSQLVEVLWDEEREYLMNMLDTLSVDSHFYAGSLIAPAFNLLDLHQNTKLIETAKRKLLDKNLGIRNVMPADFHKLIDVYKFNDMEMGAPFVYVNGGVWPQGTIWYCLGLIETQTMDKAKEVLKRYLTIEGIKNSPNGQPSFYEYRNSDPDFPEYGKIDKPTFTWAGGWYLYTLYKLMGVRENPWNISLTPTIPQPTASIEYDLTILGKLCRIKYIGNGEYFKTIKYDGEPVNSAVITHPVNEIELVFGVPKEPYLSQANCLVDGANYDSRNHALKIKTRGVKNQSVGFEIIAPHSVKYYLINGKKSNQNITENLETTVYRIDLDILLPQNETEISVVF
jgi:hypothetical protein